MEAWLRSHRVWVARRRGCVGMAYGGALEMTDLEIARARLEAGDLRFVLVRGGEVLAEDGRHGILPVYERARDQPALFAGASLADAVLGRAAVLLLRNLGLVAAYGGLVSAAALAAANASGMSLAWGRVVTGLLDRAGTTACPFEAATASCSTGPEALAAVASVLADLAGGGRPDR